MLSFINLPFCIFFLLCRKLDVDSTNEFNQWDDPMQQSHVIIMSLFLGHNPNSYSVKPIHFLIAGSFAKQKLHHRDPISIPIFKVRLYPIFDRKNPLTGFSLGNFWKTNWVNEYLHSRYIHDPISCSHKAYT